MKNDIKYIIKRIIIGVGIATGVMLVKSLPVFAEEKNINAYLKYGSYESDRRFYIQSSEITTDIKIFDKIKVFDNTNFSLNVKTSDTSLYNEKNIKLVLLDKTNNVYYFLVLKTYIFANNGSIKDSYKKLNLSFSDSDMSYSMLNDGNSISGSITFPLAVGKTALPYNNSYNVEEKLNNETYYFNIPKSNSNDYKGRILGSYTDFSNFVICYKSDDFPTTEQIFINNIQIEDNTGSSIPTVYEKIDMLGKDAVLFYPKDFREIDNVCSETSSIIGGSVAMCNQFDYYYTFYLKGSFDSALKNLGLNSSEYDRIALENYPKTTEYTKIVKSNYYDTGILFYPTNISSGTGSVASSEYKVYYDSSKLNYIIIDNIDDFTGEDISYIDKNGDEVSTKIDSVKKRTDIEYSGSDDFNVDYDENSIKSFDISSGFKSFINMLSDGVSFFKKYMGEFMKDIPQFVFYFVIFIPILSIVVAVIKIINR